jgi:DegV family protein with EDD domain
MNSIALIADSACDLPDEMLRQHEIQMVPLMILWGQDELRDRVDITPTEFYRRLVSDPTHPTTSQPAPADFARAIQQAADKGAQEAIIFTISSGMSSTYRAAQTVAQQAVIPTHVIDTKANSMSEGWQILAAAQERARGGTVESIIAAADQVRQKSVTLLYVDTLEYLHRGGRIGSAAKWLGTLLDLKPQLFVDHTTGQIKPGARVRTRSRALDSLVQTFFQQVDTSKPLHIAVMHGDCPDDANVIADRIRREYAPAALIVAVTSPVMGVHTGPMALALCGY